MKSKQPDLKLRCPIRAHADKCNEDGPNVGLPVCGKDQTFPGTDKLNEHISRVHSHKFVCTRCKAKFSTSTNKNDLAYLQDRHASCKEEPWPEKREKWAKWTLMSKEQHDRWTNWTLRDNERRKPAQDGQREKKALWSWRKIYESLYPNTVNFPDASFGAGQLADADQTTLPDTEKPAATRTSHEPQQDPVAAIRDSSQPSTNQTLGNRMNPDRRLMNPYSADQVLTNEWAPETEITWQETSVGPGSMTFSSTSGTTDTLPPPPPPSSYYATDYQHPWLFTNTETPHDYTGVRVDDIFGKPHEFFSEAESSPPKSRGEDDF